MARAGNSDEEDDNVSEASGKASNQGNGSRYNLLTYNRERKIRLNEFDFTMDRGETEADDDFE